MDKTINTKILIQQLEDHILIEGVSGSAEALQLYWILLTTQIAKRLGIPLPVMCGMLMAMGPDISKKYGEGVSFNFIPPVREED